MRQKDLMAGGMLIAIGAIFLASNLGAMPEVNFVRLWPVILIVLGLGKLFVPDEDGRWGGVVLLLIASIFLAHNYHVYRLRDTWPMFIVIAGLSVMFGSRGKRS